MTFLAGVVLGFFLGVAVALTLLVRAAWRMAVKERTYKAINDVAEAIDKEQLRNVGEERFRLVPIKDKEGMH